MFPRSKKAVFEQFWKTVEEQVRPNKLACELNPDNWCSENIESIRIAIASCTMCPVQSWCQRVADTDPKESSGVWAGKMYDNILLKECEACNELFIPTRGDRQRFCSSDCRDYHKVSA